MNFRKIIGLAICAMTVPVVSFAHGEIWYDVSAHVPQYKKLVIYPITSPENHYLISDDEDTDIYKANDHLDKRFVRKLKFKTIPLGRTVKENKEIRTDETKYQSLYQDFPSEAERGKVVFEVTGADGYLKPYVHEMRTEPHHSPEIWVNVQMRSYTKVSGSPRGDYTTNERTWTEQHRIPYKELMLYHMSMGNYLYDRNGKQVLIYFNEEHTYGEKYGGLASLFGGGKSLNAGNYGLEMFKHLVKEFREDVGDVKNNFKENKDKQRMGPRMGFGNLNLPSNIAGNENLSRCVNFYLKDAAFRKTKVPVNYGDENDKPVKYEVVGNLYKYTLQREWIPPHVDTSDSYVSSREEKWRDKNGNEHTTTYTDYKTSISDVYGKWVYTATVSGDFALVDTNTGRTVVSYSGTETDDKRGDAYRHLVDKFYDEVNDFFKSKGYGN